MVYDTIPDTTVPYVTEQNATGLLILISLFRAHQAEYTFRDQNPAPVFGTGAGWFTRPHDTSRDSTGLDASTTQQCSH